MTWAQFESEAMISVVQDWLDHPRELGRTLAVGCSENTAVERLYQIKKRFNGKVVLISVNNDNGIYPKALIIPIGSTSELFISFNDEEGIKLESVPTGKIQLTVDADLTYFDVVWSNPSTFIDKCLSRLADIYFIFIIFMFVFLFSHPFYYSLPPFWRVEFPILMIFDVMIAVCVYYFFLFNPSTPV
ncbi:hypothetical protein CAEBREN_18357 [Caenorhabditis brenneri]|uniref:Uncharacterized protein n=1 Tax=Caenorhabditis brenneri TaxID=135651 RepID=G0MDN8_CAEBE|nr:hypothetical protein CAEBREN_18357 [Caenorhabditis brenneri]